MGATQRQIARTFNCTQTTISKLIIRYQQTGQTQDRPRSGRPRVTTPAEDRYIGQIHLRNRCVTATSTAATALGHAISRRTVLRLRTAGIRAYRPFRGMALTVYTVNADCNGHELYVGGSDVTGRECSLQMKVGSVCSGTMAEFEFFDEGESDWGKTALQKFTRLEVEASWYGVAFVARLQHGWLSSEET
ncbi:uncharacterized protein LOC125382930 [Haliotis rufescens]|uniref:uncharacterized protein LOC125382930 n=1 Tax=Haliotis rufescens TaxID=6454 RepID=UPI00201E7520|nr:uncharacterized protein LOC125382930 [Haliotis rufescens]